MSVTQQQILSLLENVLFESATQAAANAAIWEADAAATSISSLATAMASSGEEKIAATVVGYYLTALGRAPTAAEIHYYVAIAEQGLTAAQISAGDVSGATWDQIAQYFSHSAEFAARAGLNNGLDATGALLEAVPWLYESVLGRSASTAEVSYYDNQVLNGASLGTLFREFTASPEFHSDTDTQIAQALAAYGTAVASGEQPPATVGAGVELGAQSQTPPPSTSAPPPSTIFTTGTDHIVTTDASLVLTASLGTGATLTAGDSVSGAGNELDITDISGAASQDILPSVSLSGVATITLTTSGNAGTDIGHPFDLSGASGLTAFSLTSSGSAGDFIKAGSGVAVTIGSVSAEIGVAGGFASLAITDAHLGTLDLTGSAGTVSITDATGPTSLTVNVATLTLAGFTDLSNHISQIVFSGSASAPAVIGSISDTALNQIRLTDGVSLGTDSSHMLTLSNPGIVIYGDGGSGYSADNADNFITLASPSAIPVVYLGNGDNTIVDNSANGSGIVVGNGDNTLSSTVNGTYFQVGTGVNTITLDGNSFTVNPYQIDVDYDAAYVAGAVAPNLTINNAATGVIVEYTSEPTANNVIQLYSGSSVTVSAILQDMESAVSALGHAATMYYKDSVGGNTYVVANIDGQADSATNMEIIKISGVHDLGEIVTGLSAYGFQLIS